jgi:hypothetical protein
LLFPNAIAWVYWRLHGNWLRHSIIAGSYAVAIVTCILFSVYFNPGSGVVGQWPEPLLVLQIVIMVYYGAFAVGQAVRRDVNNKQLDSHRLMPLSPAAGVLGYLFGPSIVAIEFGIINLIIGTVCEGISGGSISNWIFSNGIIAAFAVLNWMAIMVAAFVSRFALGIIPGMVFVSMGPAEVAIAFCAPLAVITCPIFAAMLDRRISGNMMSVAPIGLLAQLGFFAIFFSAAIRRYRQDDVPALGTLLSLLLLGAWVLTSIVGVLFPDNFHSRFFFRRDEIETGAIAVVAVISSMLIALVSVSSAAKTSAEWLRNVAATGQSPRRRPIPPAILAFFAALIICTLATAGRPIWFHRFSMHGPFSRKSFLFTLQVFLVVVCFLLSVSFLLRIAYRSARNPLIPIGIWILLTWLVPLFAAINDDRHSDPAALSFLSPPALLADMWRNSPHIALIHFGLIGQFILMLLTALLFYTTQRKLVRRPLEPALV